MARPTIYTEELAQEICDHIADGKSLNKLCKLDNMPERMTIYRWLDANEQFCDKYRAARERQAQSFQDDILDIADDGINDTVIDGEGNERVHHDHIRRSDIRIKTRMWLMERMAPRKYGKYIKDEDSKESDEPQKVVIEVKDARNHDRDS